LTAPEQGKKGIKNTPIDKSRFQ
jgi:hypothetical protein